MALQVIAVVAGTLSSFVRLHAMAERLVRSKHASSEQQLPRGAVPGCGGSNADTTETSGECSSTHSCIGRIGFHYEQGSAARLDSQI